MSGHAPTISEKHRPSVSSGDRVSLHSWAPRSFSLGLQVHATDLTPNCYWHVTRPRSCSRAAAAASRWLRALAAPHRLHEASDPRAQGSSDCSSDGEGGAQAGRSVVTAAARAGEPRAQAATPTPCAHPLRGPLLRGPAASIFLWLPVAALVCGAGLKDTQKSSWI